MLYCDQHILRAAPPLKGKALRSPGVSKAFPPRRKVGGVSRSDEEAYPPRMLRYLSPPHQPRSAYTSLSSFCCRRRPPFVATRHFPRQAGELPQGEALCPARVPMHSPSAKGNRLQWVRCQAFALFRVSGRPQHISTTSSASCASVWLSRPTISANTRPIR